MLRPDLLPITTAGAGRGKDRRRRPAKAGAKRPCGGPLQRSHSLKEGSYAPHSEEPSGKRHLAEPDFTGIGDDVHAYCIQRVAALVGRDPPGQRLLHLDVDSVAPREVPRFIDRVAHLADIDRRVPDLEDLLALASGLPALGDRCALIRPHQSGSGQTAPSDHH